MTLAREGVSDRRSLAVLVALVIGIGGASQWWSLRRDDTLGHEIAALARPGDIRMLSSETCAFCTRARHWMNARGVTFGECFVERDAACAERMRALGLAGTPVLLVRGRAQLGFDPERLRQALQAG